MTVTFVELSEKLKRLDEVILLDLLALTSEDLVERFADIIELRYEQLQEATED